MLKREEIEEKRWNGCVHYALNSQIYGYTWYLDNVSEEWWGLVEGNYESVMPLVWNSKLLGKKQIYQPLLCQQLGVFSVRALSKTRIQYFLDAIPDEFVRIQMCLNDQNLYQQLEGFEIQERPNYLLKLNQSYDDIYDAYSSNVKRNLKKARKERFTLTSNIKPERLVGLMRDFHEKRNMKVPEQTYHAAHRIIYNCLHRGLGFMSGALDSEGELCAAIFFMYHTPKIVNLLNVTTDKGREHGAMHYLLDAFIQNHAGKRVMLDFEGSEIEGIARFYKSFGAENHPYPCLTLERMPWYLRVAQRLRSS